MSSPQNIPHRSPGGDREGPFPESPRNKFLMPSPVPTRRNRTYSASERAAAGPTRKGKIREFDRHKGHGFVIPDENGPDLFCHISDIDGEYVPKAGDTVMYKRCPCPPKMEKFSAVHVTIIDLVPGQTHERWDMPSPGSSPRT